MPLVSMLNEPNIATRFFVMHFISIVYLCMLLIYIVLVTLDEGALSHTFISKLYPRFFLAFFGSVRVNLGQLDFWFLYL